MSIALYPVAQNAWTAVYLDPHGEMNQNAQDGETNDDTY